VVNSRLSISAWLNPIYNSSLVKKARSFSRSPVNASDIDTLGALLTGCAGGHRDIARMFKMLRPKMTFADIRARIGAC